MNVLYIEQPYEDTLLALGIAAAYNVQPQYHGNNYIFPDDGDLPIRFPLKQKEEDPFDPPFNYHRFKASGVYALGGGGLLSDLESQWNDTEPTYAEVIDLVLSFNEPDWKKTRFWNVQKRHATSATFRPLATKGQNQTKADSIRIKTVREFWLYDALRAIGFLTYAQPKLLIQEAATSRWLVFLPCHPVEAYCDSMLRQPDLRSAAVTLCMAHLIAAEMNIPEVYVAKYAELHPNARTTLGALSIEPPNLDQSTIDDLKRFLYSLDSLPLAEADRLASNLLNVLERQDLASLAQINLTAASLNTRGARVYGLSENTLTDLITCERLKN